MAATYPNLVWSRPVSGSPRTRILLINDIEDVAASLKMLLELLGEYEVQIAETGWGGLWLACCCLPDIIISDIDHPGPDGYRLAALLRKNRDTAQVPLIALTGYSSEEDRQHGLESGFDYFLTVPVDHEELLALLAQVARHGNE
jgi:CheY-like chemotaxis protein